MAAAVRLRYRPNFAARALASRHSGLIGLGACRLEDPLVASIAAAAQRSLERRGYGTVLATNTAWQPAAMAAALAPRGVEGLMFLGRAPMRGESEALAAQGLPWVAVADSENEAASCIDIGRVRGTELACRYLVELGHRSVGVLAPHESDSGPSLAKRLEAAGARIALARADPDDPEAIRRAVRQLLDAHEPPTAMVCTTDVAALVAIRECALRRIPIPEAVSIVGFGDECFARCSHPALTTVRVSTAELGARAADVLIDTLAGNEPATHAPSVKLVLRETTAAPLSGCST